MILKIQIGNLDLLISVGIYRLGGSTHHYSEDLNVNYYSHFDNRDI